MTAFYRHSDNHEVSSRTQRFCNGYLLLLFSAALYVPGWSAIQIRCIIKRVAYVDYSLYERMDHTRALIVDKCTVGDKVEISTKFTSKVGRNNKKERQISLFFSGRGVTRTRDLTDVNRAL